MAQTTADIRIAACPGWVRHNAYFVTRCLVGVTAVGASGEIWNVSQVFQPDGPRRIRHRPSRPESPARVVANGPTEVVSVPLMSAADLPNMLVTPTANCPPNTGVANV